ncbi:MAG: bifunctional diaminohydroxyphosphoribosylaminopyrimidine deaminase/5-amino-6-(5-phosphoribosylamino)uracil reductase RibD [Phormidesmis sp.]
MTQPDAQNDADNSAENATDATIMIRCCELAAQAAGCTAPNPLVGSVIMQGEKTVGEGFHPKAGEPHAEIFALRAAGNRAQNAELYVNLEPCNHTGKTPPCSSAIIQAGIRRVVIGMKDPNPEASGGIQTLRAAGIEVKVGVEGDRCRQLNEAFIYRVTQHAPFGILKYAMTLDGKIATNTGHSAWVSGPSSRQRVHQLRSQSDAVIVGGNTVRQDNPSLTSHGQGKRNPLRVVMSRQLNLPAVANLWDTSAAPTVIFTEADINTAVGKALQQQGVEIVSVSTLRPAAVMKNLYERGLMSVLWECGGTLAAAAIADASVQKVWAFIAPKLIGGKAAPSPIGELGLVKMTEAKALKHVSVTPVGEDFLLRGYL